MEHARFDVSSSRRYDGDVATSAGDDDDDESSDPRLGGRLSTALRVEFEHAGVDDEHAARPVVVRRNARFVVSSIVRSAPVAGRRNVGAIVVVQHVGVVLWRRRRRQQDGVGTASIFRNVASTSFSKVYQKRKWDGDERRFRVVGVASATSRKRESRIASQTRTRSLVASPSRHARVESRVPRAHLESHLPSDELVRARSHDSQRRARRRQRARLRRDSPTSTLRGVGTDQSAARRRRRSPEHRIRVARRAGARPVDVPIRHGDRVA